jgi:hypothetical protein
MCSARPSKSAAGWCAKSKGRGSKGPPAKKARRLRMEAQKAKKARQADRGRGGAGLGSARRDGGARGARVDMDSVCTTYAPVCAPASPTPRHEAGEAR